MLHPIYINILLWYDKNKRDLPWRNHSDIYTIWLSEIILQQTRTQQAIPYFNSFKNSFPNIESLAISEDKEIMKMWEGLGYYNRARNMIKTARIVHSEYKNEFPRDYEGLLKLPGIGPYTAAAISSIASGEKKIALDGNLKRVFARLYGIKDEINQSSAINSFLSVGDQLLAGPTDAGSFNQALMDLGATICTPKSPSCENCPVREHCYALENDLIDELPYKKKSKAKKKRKMTYLLLEKEGKVYLQNRNKDDIWPDLYEFLLVEDLQIQQDYDKSKADLIFQKKHILSHQILDISVYRYDVDISLPDKQKWVDISELDQYAFPAALRDLKNQLIASPN